MAEKNWRAALKPGDKVEVRSHRGCEDLSRIRTVLRVTKVAIFLSDGNGRGWSVAHGRAIGDTGSGFYFVNLAPWTQEREDELRALAKRRALLAKVEAVKWADQSADVLARVLAALESADAP